MAELLILSFLANLILMSGAILLWKQKRDWRSLVARQLDFIKSQGIYKAQSRIEQINLQVENEMLQDQLTDLQHLVQHLKEVSKQDPKIEQWLYDRIFYFSPSKIQPNDPRKEASHG